MASDLFKFKFSKPASQGNLGRGAGKDDDSDRLDEATFTQIRDLIYELSGIFYSESKKYLLEGRISKRLLAKRLNSYEEYFKLINSTQGKEEIRKLFEVITINETYFFRAEQQFEAFEQVLLPEIIEQKKDNPVKTVRIWSSATSSGEEAYTISMLVLEKLQRKYPDVRFQILASDINSAILDTARKGVYKEYAIRNLPDLYLKKYFRRNGSQFIINNEVKKNVKFMRINLFNPQEIKIVTSCDVIFCCNVLIYFNLTSKQQVVSHLYDALNKNGYLFIGYSESLHGVSKAFKLVHLPKAMAYKKE